MGRGMAHRLLAAGFPLIVFNRNRARSVEFGAAGATIANSPREAAAGAEVIVSMVADDVASRAVWLGENGALAGARNRTLTIECSTLTVKWTKELANAAAAAGCDFIDAPVTGSKGPAAAGELNFLIGGSEAAINRARPILAPMSRSMVHLGPIGSGARMKLINNFLAGVQVAALGEALAWIERSELDRAKALGLITAGAPGSPIVKTICERMAASDFEPNFRLRLMAKDLAYAQLEAQQADLQLTTAAAASTIFQNAIAAGYGDKDMAAVAEPLRRVVQGETRSSGGAR